MAAVGIRFDYEKERRMSLKCCTTVLVMTILHFTIMSFSGCKFKNLSSFDRFFSIPFFRLLQYGSSLQVLLILLNLLRQFSSRFAALNRFLR